jgi:two-component sensor histidine kinase/PAS domain-containing protein
VFEVLPIGLWFADENGRLLRGNPAGVEIWGAEPRVPIEEYGVFKARRLPSGEAVAPEDWALAHTVREKATIADELLEIESFDGKKKIILNYTSPVIDNSGKLLGVIILNVDITAKHNAEQELRETEARVRDSKALLDATQRIACVGGWEWDVGQKTMIWTDETYRIHGMTPGDPAAGSPEHIERSLSCYDPDDRPLIEAAFHRCAEDGLAYDLEFPLSSVDGKRIWIRTMANAVNEDGRAKKVIGTIMDITDRKQIEAMLAQQLTEKDILLREVHHRVKNNIAGIKSLLSLQAAAAAGPEVRDALQEALSRVQSMSELYEKLLLSDTYHETPLKEYAEDLLGSILQIFPDRAKADVETKIDDFLLDTNRAVSVGIILNELVTNVFKHAFVNRPAGTISVGIEKAGSMVTLAVRDDGVGSGTEAGLETNSGFGLTLVRMLTEQLNGTLCINTDRGYSTEIVFPVDGPVSD